MLRPAPDIRHVNRGFRAIPRGRLGLCNTAHASDCDAAMHLSATLQHGKETLSLVQPKEEGDPTKTAETIKNDVEQELRWEPSVCATKIGVSVNGGAVELDGHVSSLYGKWAAERAALKVANVTSIASEIVVDLPFGSERTDEDIASAAIIHLTWNYLVPDTIKLKVSNGWVTLQGSAEVSAAPLVGGVAYLLKGIQRRRVRS